MNKQDFQDWKRNPITKEIFSNILEWVEEVQSRSKIRDTSDQTAMQCARDEGICDGMAAFADYVDDMQLEMEAEDE